MKIEFNEERYARLVEQAAIENSKMSVRDRRPSEAEIGDYPPEAQFSEGFRKSTTLTTLAAVSLATGLNLPGETLAVFMGVAYRMGLEDARQQSEIAELNKIFDAPTS